jgi:hypothetical protein
MIDRDPVGGTPTGGGRSDSLNSALDRRNALGAQPPKDFIVVREGSGVRLCILERDKKADRSGSVTYVFGNALDVDTSTQAGLDGGSKRAAAAQCGQVTAPPNLDDEATEFLIDSRYQGGTFYCWGVDSTGGRSDAYLWSQLSFGSILDTTVPADFTHFDASESGEEVTPGVIDSVLTVTGRAPIPLGSLDGPQVYLGNYTNLGSIEESDFRRYTGPPGGSITFKIPLQLVRRKGVGTINVTNGSPNITITGGALLSQVHGGDQLELFGLRFYFNDPVDNNTVVLTTNWTGQTGSFPDWKIVPLVTVYFVSVSKGGTRRPDIQNAPSRFVLFDGDLSAPVAPTILGGAAMGNTNRIDVQQPIGTSLDVLHLWRATGSGQPFSSCVEIKSIQLNPSLPTAASGVLQFTDDKFTLSQREHGQAFTYFCTVTNLRRDPSPPSAPLEIICRLNSSGDGDPTLPSRDGFKNLLFNGFIGGVGLVVGGVANVVDETDATQDTFNFNPAIAPQTLANIGTGASRLRAWTRWRRRQTNQGTVYPTHINGNEVKLPPPGIGVVGSEKDVGIEQYLSGWNAPNAIDRKLQKGQYVTVQFLVYCDAGVTPDGSLFVGVAQYNAGASSWALWRHRLSDDTFVETSTPFTIAASQLAAFSPSLPMKIYATFHLSGSVTTDKIATVIAWQQGTTSNLYVRQGMDNDGYELAPWTADMGNIDMYYPAAVNGGGPVQDGDGKRDGTKMP